MIFRKPKEKETPEHRVYRQVELWQPLAEALLPEGFLPLSDPHYPIFYFLYQKTKEAYKTFPKRKNGEDPFLHPLNVVHYLRKAGVEDGVTLCAALIHDLIEDKVELYGKKQDLRRDKKSVRLFEQYEEQQFQALEAELDQYCRDNHLSALLPQQVLNIVRLLTRHKKHWYYYSIAAIYSCRDLVIKEKAMQVKLADRIHNIQSLNGFTPENKIYSCFKNLFILNNTKRFLLDRSAKKRGHRPGESAVDLLFKKCCKATYAAFLGICQDLSREKSVARSKAVLQLAFRKFAWEYGGLWAVTTVHPREPHPLRLFQGIVRKYDARLHHEFARFEKLQQNEMVYCKRFFADFRFREKHLLAIVNYKDAFALKEVIARLLYKKNYVISGFGCFDLFLEESG